ncbi:hypothetical protein EVAR_11317_1 [Eumeta japonica]|uniref:Uncharacterized protein n=1 Tax=Eumeta variegata TaxID=151549 RepID=A0A4C1U158_EUMVA|nr:hypothetical protein EVAR_11317_1 [Eumeta japonica]
MKRNTVQSWQTSFITYRSQLSLLGVSAGGLGPWTSRRASRAPAPPAPPAPLPVLDTEPLGVDTGALNFITSSIFESESKDFEDADAFIGSHSYELSITSRRIQNGSDAWVSPTLQQKRFRRRRIGRKFKRYAYSKNSLSSSPSAVIRLQYSRVYAVERRTGNHPTLDRVRMSEC